MYINVKKIKIFKLTGVLLFIVYLVFFIWAMHFSIHPEAGYDGSYIAKLPVFEFMLLVGLYILGGQYLYFRCVVFNASKNRWSIFFDALWSIVGVALAILGVLGI